MNYEELFAPVLENARKAYEEGKVVPAAYEHAFRTAGDEKWKCCAIGAYIYERDASLVDSDYRSYSRFQDLDEIRGSLDFITKAAEQLESGREDVAHFEFGFDAGFLGLDWEALCKTRRDLRKGPAKVGYGFGVEVAAKYKK